jgi:hypothetical protein
MYPRRQALRGARATGGTRLLERGSSRNRSYSRQPRSRGRQAPHRARAPDTTQHRAGADVVSSMLEEAVLGVGMEIRGPARVAVAGAQSRQANSVPAAAGCPHRRLAHLAMESAAKAAGERCSNAIGPWSNRRFPWPELRGFAGVRREAANFGWGT